MYVLVICKFKMDRINSNREKVETSFFKRSKAAYSLVSGGVLPKLNSFTLLCISPLPAIIKKDPIKNEGVRVTTTFFLLYVNGDFSKVLRAANTAVRGRIWPNFEFFRDLMTVLGTSKN